MFAMRLFKVAADQSEHSMHVIKLLVAEKYKPCKIYKTLLDVCGESCFYKEKYLQMGWAYSFASTSLSRKERPCSENPLSLW